jgi:hypothetical protein
LVEQKLQLPVSISGKNAWDVAREISLSAGEILLDWWPKSKEISDKGQNDIVTNVDRECEAHIRETLEFLGRKKRVMTPQQDGRGSLTLLTVPRTTLGEFLVSPLLSLLQRMEKL